LKGGGEDLKNHGKSSGYIYKTLKISRYFSKQFRKKFTNLKKILIFTRYNKIGGGAPRSAECDTWTRLFRKIFCKNGIPIQKGDLRFQNDTDAGILFNISVFIKRIILKTKRKPWNQGTLTPPAEASCRGAILIEFAVCMPILIILLFYINDLMRIKRYYAQTEFVAQQMANIIQNISQKRSNKRIYLNDIRYAASLAFLSMFPGNTRWTTDNSACPYAPGLHMAYVASESDNKASVKWLKNYTNYNGTTPSTYGYLTGGPYSSIKSGTDVTPSSIYPTLKINKGESKILIDINLYSEPYWHDHKKVFGLYLVKPKTSFAPARLFDSVVIFTPKDGLFSTDPPTES